MASTQLSASFTSIPDELLLKTLSFCDALGIIRCSQTCRSLHALVQASPLLQYQAELEIAGLYDPALYTASINYERLHEFCAQRDAQKIRVENNSVVGLPSRTHRFTDGSIRTQCIGNALARFTQSDNFTLTSLTTFETWTWAEPLVTRYKRFRICPKMNVFVGIRTAEGHVGPIFLDVFDLTTGRQHPEATSSCLTLTESTGHRIFFAPIVRILEDLVFVWWSYATPSGKSRETSIMEWKTGKLLKDDERSRIGCPRPITRDLVIRQRNFDEEDFDTTISIEVQKRTTQFPECGDYTTVARFLLPRIRGSPNFQTTFVILQINISDPNELRVGSSNQRRKLESSASSQLVCLTWGAPGDYYTIVTPLSTFQDFQVFPSGDQDINGCSRVIPWDKWGPKNTRLLQTDCGTDQIHGNRLMLLSETGGVKDILDFNQLDIARDKHRASLGSQASPDIPMITPHIMDKPNVILSSRFSDKVETSLPYRTVFQSADRTPSWHLSWILREDICSLSSNRECDEVTCFKYDNVMDL